MEEITSFGAWLRRRRRTLDLTQAELAARVGCVAGTIKSIEAEARRPSKQLAERLANVLDLRPEDRAAFLKAARAELAPDRLPSAAVAPETVLEPAPPSVLIDGSPNTFRDALHRRNDRAVIDGHARALGDSDLPDQGPSRARSRSAPPHFQPTTHPTLHIQLLGDFRLVYGDTIVSELNSARLQSFLAYLLLRRHTLQSRQQLAFLLWPDSTEAQARVNLRSVLHRLRQVLPDADYFLHADVHTLEWLPNRPVVLDVADFETALIQAEQATRAGDWRALQVALEQLVSLYQGDLLPGCYDDWILPERERLREQLIGALEQLIAVTESHDDYRTAIVYAQRLLRHDPLHEATFRRLMHLYALIGDRVSALRTYRTCVTVLERELAVEPSHSTRELYERLLDAAILPVAELPVPRPTGNLPLQLTNFIGRKREMKEIGSLLRSTRLLTLTGPGGCGKTRLALQVATDLLAVQEFPDGVWWIELAALSDADLVPQVLVTALNVREIPGRTLALTLADYLQHKHLLLVLDNCEHVVAACAYLAETLLRTCPNVWILATSRERLGITGESSWLVPSLSLPSRPAFPSGVGAAALPLEQLAQYEAIALFCERATAVLPTFRLTRQNVAAIVLVCQRLDGIPLAIVLAAARVKVLAVEQIAARLDDRFALLTSGSRTALPRHRTLQATIDWSYDLLSASEQVLFHRLSIFAGGFSLEAAEAVCGGEGLKQGEVLELLSYLEDKSLVTVEDRGEYARYGLLETIRQYARDKLHRSGENLRIRNRQLEFFVEFVEAAEPQLFGTGQVVWLNRLELEYDNLRAAVEWTRESGAVLATLRLAGALRRFWYVRGQHGEGLSWLTEALARPEAAPRTVMRAKALTTAGHLELLKGHFAEAAQFLREALDIGREVGDQWTIAMALHILGLLAIGQRDFTTAYAYFQEDVAIWQSISGTPGSAMSFMHFGSLMYLGDIMLYWEDYERGKSLYEESAGLLRTLGDKNLLAYPMRRLAQVALHQGNYEQALVQCQQSLALNLDVGDKRGIAACLAALAAIEMARGEMVQAAQLFGAVASLLEASNMQLLALDADLCERNVAVLRAQLDDPTFTASWSEGRTMTLSQGIELASNL
jgi:predicted ATPase/DNA-binding SARP family transcriptional activator/transcriptional regulator with XRE-family HTH domain